MKLPVTTCPACQIALPPGATACPDCQEDLSALMRLQLAPYVAYNAGLRLAAQGDLDGAILKLRDAAVALPGEQAVYDVLGKAYAQKGERAQARAWWRRALARWPDDWTARKGLAELDALAETEAAGAQDNLGRQRRQAWLIGLLGAGLGGLLVALAAFVIVPALVPPARTATQIAAVSPAATEPAATATVPPSATAPAPTLTPSPTASPSPSPLPPTPPPPTATPELPDLAGAVRAAIAEAIKDNPHRDQIDVTVRQSGYAIMLGGEVAYVGDKYMLESVAKGVPGVEVVDVSGIVVRYAVRPGDNLYGIAREMYGQSELYPLIAAANGLENPDYIRLGQVLFIPPPH